MIAGNPTDSLTLFSSSGTFVLDHLAAHGAGLAGLGDIDPVVIRVAHNRSLLCFLRKKTLPEESIFCSVTIV